MNYPFNVDSIAQIIWSLGNSLRNVHTFGKFSIQFKARIRLHNILVKKQNKTKELKRKYRHSHSQTCWLRLLRVNFTGHMPILICSVIVWMWLSMQLALIYHPDRHLSFSCQVYLPFYILFPLDTQLLILALYFSSCFCICGSGFTNSANSTDKHVKLMQKMLSLLLCHSHLCTYSCG